uniref:Uncharacterized protein n=1 Tax=Oryza punctata TaxID=4537 RepID=A0A0E0JYY3_ORYPU
MTVSLLLHDLYRGPRRPQPHSLGVRRCTPSGLSCPFSLGGFVVWPSGWLRIAAARLAHMVLFCGQGRCSLVPGSLSPCSTLGAHLSVREGGVQLVYALQVSGGPRVRHHGFVGSHQRFKQESLNPFSLQP